MISVEDILGLFNQRRGKHGPIADQMRQIRDLYNGDVVVPLPERERNEQSGVANLMALGVDQISDRIASTVPDITYPVGRPGIKSEEKRSKDKRQANLGWWEANDMELKVYRRARHLSGYGQSPVLIRPNFQTGYPMWEIKDPLGTYAAPSADPDDPCVDDVIFAVKRTLDWLGDRYPDQTSTLAKPDGSPRDTLFDVLEYIDDTEIVVCAVGIIQDDRYSLSMGQSTGRKVVELERLDNRAGVCTAVVPGRISLDRRKGQFDGMTGMYQAQARLFALEMIAVEEGIWPDEYLVGRPNEQPEVVKVADGRRGEIGLIKGGDFRQIQNQPGYKTDGTIDRLERAQRLVGGIPAEFGGESQNNVRTGRRGENILSATIDFGILQAQRVLQTSMEAENARAIAIDKGYLDTQKSFYVSWARAKGMVDYKPTDLFDSDQNIVSYAQAGADVNGLVIGAGQRVGLGTLSKRGMMELDPLIDDPEVEHDRVVYEALEAAVLQGVQSRAASGELPEVDVARIMQLVVSNQADLPEAVITAQKEAQARQAAQVPADSPAAQPGMANPGTGAQAQALPATPGEPTPENLNMLLRSLRGGQRMSPQEVRAGGPSLSQNQAAV